MRQIERSTEFKRDYKRAAKGRDGPDLPSTLETVLSLLVSDATLAPRYRDHELKGNWAGYRECHLKPDLLLIYRKSGDDLLRLARLGPHSQLFG